MRRSVENYIEIQRIDCLQIGLDNVLCNLFIVSALLHEFYIPTAGKLFRRKEYPVDLPTIHSQSVGGS